MIDLAAILDLSQRFYRGHNLVDWAAALPARAEADPAPLTHADKIGFTLGFAFPAFDVQMHTLDRLIEETACKPAALPDNQQYSAPFLADTWTKTPNGKVLQQTEDVGARSWGPYVLLMSPRPVQQAWGRTGKQIREYFDTKGWHGLTTPEYLVLQRLFCEKFGDHRFFEAPEKKMEAHSLWLIDSMNDKDCTVALGSPRGLNLQATSIANRDSQRAAVAVNLVPLV